LANTNDLLLNYIVEKTSKFYYFFVALLRFTSFSNSTTWKNNSAVAKQAINSIIVNGCVLKILFAKGK